MIWLYFFIFIIFAVIGRRRLAVFSSCTLKSLNENMQTAMKKRKRKKKRKINEN